MLFDVCIPIEVNVTITSWLSKVLQIIHYYVKLTLFFTNTLFIESI